MHNISGRLNRENQDGKGLAIRNLHKMDLPHWRSTWDIGIGSHILSRLPIFLAKAGTATFAKWSYCLLACLAWQSCYRILAHYISFSHISVVVQKKRLFNTTKS
jgi:hypothetical protein